MNNKKKIIMGLLIASLFLVAIGVTYAYFTSDINGLESSTSLTARGGVMKINYDGGAYITLSGIYPSDTAWATKNFTVTGKNTTDLDMGYKISMVVEENTFENDEITYSLSSTTPTIGTTANSVTKEYINGTGTKEIGTGNFTKTGTTSVVHSYKLTIDYPNKSEEQNVNQGASFKCHLITEDYTAPKMPNKGALITMNVGTDLTTSYRVLSVNGTIAEVLAMSDYGVSVYSTGETTTFTDGTTNITGIKYENSTIDILLNSNDSDDSVTSFYEKLNATAKRAIIPKAINQNIYSFYEGSEILETSNYTHDYQIQLGWIEWSYADLVGTVEVGERNIYLLDLEDIFNYIGKISITSNDINALFWNQTTSFEEIEKKYDEMTSEEIAEFEHFAWLRSAGPDEGPMCVARHLGTAFPSYYDMDYYFTGNPAFTIDLSKIEWSVAS